MGSHTTEPLTIAMYQHSTASRYGLVDELLSPTCVTRVRVGVLLRRT